MFKEETLFILGAGASYSYGYPLGKDLITQIINNINDDHIYLPVLYNSKKNNKYYYNKNNGIEQDGKLIDGYNFSDFRKNFEKFQHSSKETFPIIGKTPNAFGIYNIQYIEIRLAQLNEFFNLKKALIELDPVSIDTFLRDHSSHIEAGKIMIIYSLLKCEDRNKFSLNSNKDNWYSYLINDILSGVNKTEDIFNNKLNIITFNYSIDLDYCLLSKLSNIEILKNELGSDFIQQLQNKNIHHVYGQLYSNNLLEDYGQFYQDSIKSESVVDLNMQRFLKALQSIDQIKLIQSERNKKNIYKTLIKNAKEIIIIGFGFDRGNLNILGFPDQAYLYNEFLKGKKLKYMDYKGKMNSLFNQFSEIHEIPDLFIITRSTGDSIISAYQNDFKIYLY